MIKLPSQWFDEDNLHSAMGCQGSREPPVMALGQPTAPLGNEAMVLSAPAAGGGN